MNFDTPHTFVIAEIGINHNGSLVTAKKLIDVAVDAGCNAVKFQKRTPRMSLRPDQWDVVRDTPWGERMTYLEYRERIELSGSDYQEIDRYCAGKIPWFASPWDCNAVDTLVGLGASTFKIPSAKVTDLKLIKHVASYRKPVVMSTGMSNLDEIYEAVDVLLPSVPQLALLVCTSSYPANIKDLHLNRIATLQTLFPRCIIGYSGHETGLWSTLCAVAMGARIIERHLTLDRSLPGSDQAASVEPQGLRKLVKEIRNLETARGSGEICVHECEAADIARLR